MQTRKKSMTESLVNLAVGYVVAVASQILIFPWFGINVGIGSNAAIGVWFSVVSVIRSYCLRRAFERWAS
jgi:hypothetical protein